MKIQITLILLITCLLSLVLVSAETIYAGNNYTFQVDTTNNLVYTIVSNQSDMIGFSVFQDIFSDYSNITISTVLNFAPDSFTVVLFENITNEVIKEVIVYRSGGHKTKYVDKIINQTKIVYVPEYINNTDQTDIINLTPEDLTPEEKGWLGEFWGWIKNIINFIFSEKE